MRFQLGDYVPYLVNRAGVSFSNTFSRELDRFGITLPMWRVMAALLDEGEQRLGDLSRITAIELSTLSRITASMDRAGLVNRRRSGEDARAVLITLSKDGRRMAEAIVPKALQWESAAIAGMSEDEVKTLKGLLQRIYGNVEGREAVVR